MLYYGARFAHEVETAPVYRMYVISGEPERPGLVRTQQGGASIKANSGICPQLR